MIPLPEISGRAKQCCSWTATTLPSGTPGPYYDLSPLLKNRADYFFDIGRYLIA